MFRVCGFNQETVFFVQLGSVCEFFLRAVSGQTHSSSIICPPLYQKPMFIFGQKLFLAENSEITIFTISLELEVIFCFGKKESIGLVKGSKLA